MRRRLACALSAVGGAALFAACASAPEARIAPETAKHPRATAPLALLPPANLSFVRGEGRAFQEAFREEATRRGESFVPDEAVEIALVDLGVRFTSEMRAEDVIELSRRLGTGRIAASAVLYAAGDPLPQCAIEIRVLDGETGGVAWSYMDALGGEELRSFFGPPTPRDLEAVRRNLAARAAEALAERRPTEPFGDESGLRAWRDSFFLLRPVDRIAVLPFLEPGGGFRGPGSAIARALSTAIAESSGLEPVPISSLIAALETLDARSPIELDAPRLKRLAEETGAACIVSGTLTRVREGIEGQSDEPTLALEARALNTFNGKYVWACALERRGGISPGLLARDNERSLAEIFVSSSRAMARSILNLDTP